MTIRRTTGATALALALLLGATAAAFGQQGQMPMQPGMPGQGMGPGTMGQGMGPGMMGQGMGPGMMGHGMDPGMMGQGMGPGMMGQGMGPGMMGQGMGPGMMGQGMGPGMMGQGMGPGMMGQGMGPGMMGQGMPGHGALGGLRITPVFHLSVEDVRHFFEHHLEVHALQHLKVGEVRQTDDDTITADIVTQENSLALQIEVDPHTGLVKKLS